LITKMRLVVDGGFGMVWPFCCVFVRADGLEILDLFWVEVLRCAQDDSGWWWVVGRFGHDDLC
jgi:hypothetical protein